MPSRDGVIRGVRLKTKNGYLERAVQHLYPLELWCDDESDDAKAKDNDNENNLNVHAKEFRPRRSAAAVSELLSKEMLENERLEPVIEYWTFYVLYVL